MALITDTLSDFIQSHHLAHRSICVGLSGGVDSVVLLYAFHALKKTYPSLSCRAIHVDHGLQEASDDWRTFCEKLCADLAVPFYCASVKVMRSGGQSLEAEARKARYGVFREQLNAEEVLCLAQHQNDQLETILLQLMRGAGLAGLVAMPEMQPFEQGFIARPLLNIPKADILAYAHANELNWCDDPSNQDKRLRRNALREEVVPLLESIQPGFLNNVSRSVRHLQEAKILLDDLAQRLLSDVQTEMGLSLSLLKGYNAIEQKCILRRWFLEVGVQMPSGAIMQRILFDMIDAGPNAKPQVEWAEVKLVRELGVLRLVSR